MPKHSNYLTNILIDPVAVVLFIERVQEQSVNAKFKGAERKEEIECVASERAIRTKSTEYMKQKKRKTSENKNYDAHDATYYFEQFFEFAVPLGLYKIDEHWENQVRRSASS